LNNQIERHTPTSVEIDSIIYKMRTSDVDDMISMWNEVSTLWSVSSVAQIHKSLSDSGHIQKIIDRVKATQEIIAASG
jgi:hypothetical protein